MDTGTIGLKILEILSPLLLAALTWASVKLAELVRAKVKNEYLKGVLVRLDDAVFTAVKDLQQTVVDQIKAASADGKITDDEKKEIKRRALEAVKAHLGVKGLSEVGTILGLGGGAVESLLSSKVEAAVHDLRRATPAAPKPEGPVPPLAVAPAA